MLKINGLLILFLLFLSACRAQVPVTPPPPATMVPGLQPIETPTPPPGSPPAANQNLRLEVTAPFVDVRDCPELACSVIGRFEQGTILTAVSRTGSPPAPWLEVEYRGKIMGWIQVDQQNVDIPNGLWDSLNLHTFIVATATP